MVRLAVVLFCSFLFIQPLLRAADSTTDLFQILQLIDEKKYPEAIAGYQKYMQTAPPWFQGPIQFEIATLQAALGQKKEALETMEESIQSGFDDCFAVKQYPEWNPLRENFQFATLHAKMRISEADFKELAWLKAEIENVNHDTKAMITDNVNRMDTNFTEIARSEIPARQTTSAAVLFNREMLRTMHEAQKYYVNASDKERIEHVGTMGIVAGASNDEAMNSARLAEQAAAKRKIAIQQRKFIPPTTDGSEARACIELK